MQAQMKDKSPRLSQARIAVAQAETTVTHRVLWTGVVTLAMVLLMVLPAFAKPDSLAPLAEKISPSVVNITTSTVVAGQTGGPQGIVPEGSPFEDFFRDFQDRNGEDGRPRRSAALGSGFVISEDGYVVTNNHVIDGADEILIEFFSGEELKATLIGTDPKTDIALLKVESDEPLPFVSFGDSDDARVGDWVVAMGNPLGQGFSVSAGIVSARNRVLSGPAEAYGDFIQTDAAINRGNSGGPLFNMDGDVIGVNTAILSPSPNAGSIGIGFSMASNVVTRVVDQLKEFGETRRGWLGVRIQDLTEDVAEAMGMENDKGALVADVFDGPSKDAGILTGDVIISLNGAEVKDTRSLVRLVGNSPVGTTVRVVVFRDGTTKTLKVVLGRREEAEEAIPAAVEAPEDEADEKELLGMRLSTLTTELRERLGVAEGTDGLVVMDVEPTSEAFEKGLRVDDVITEAGQQKVADIASFEERIEATREAGRKSLLLLVRRGGEPRFVALNLEK